MRPTLLRQLEFATSDLAEAGVFALDADLANDRGVRPGWRLALGLPQAGGHVAVHLRCVALSDFDFVLLHDAVISTRAQGAAS